MAKNKNDYAVVVGINHYLCEILGDLEGPENDAEGFNEWLVSETGGALDGAHVHLILSSDYPAGKTRIKAKPTTSEVDDAFAEIIDEVKKLPQGRRLYIFLAGHGITPQSNLKESALLMANAGEGLMGYNIPGRLYLDALRKNALFKELVLFMDCCRDDYPYATVHNPPWNIDVKEDARDVSEYTGFATKWSSKSRERAIDNPNKVEGLFSHALLKALNSGRLTGTELKGLVLDYIKKLIGEDVYQEPEITLDPNKDIIFSEAAEPISCEVRITFTPEMLGHKMVLEDSKFKTLGKIDATAEPWIHNLKKDTYRVRDRMDDKNSIIFEVTGGGTIDVRL